MRLLPIPGRSIGARGLARFVVVLLAVLSGAASVGVSPASAARIAAGQQHTCAITPAGGVVCWGNRSGGTLGDGVDTNSKAFAPVAAVGLDSGVTDISTMYSGGSNGTTCAIQRGALKCWGANGGGTVGDGTVVNRSVPTQVTGLEIGVTDVSNSGSRTCAVKDGQAYCWGDLGGASTTKTPTLMPGVPASGIKQVALGRRHACLLTDTGDVWCWYGNEHGQRGAGVSAGTPPSKVAVLSGAASLTAGFDVTCIITAAGGAKCIGWGIDGLLGNPAGGAQSTTPVEPVGLGSGVTDLSAHWYTICAVKSGETYCWGNNDNGQTGTGSFPAAVTTPTLVAGGLAGSVSTSTSGDHSCTQLATGANWCWGLNSQAQLGNAGVASRSLVPVEAGRAADVPAPDPTPGPTTAPGPTPAPTLAPKGPPTWVKAGEPTVVPKAAAKPTVKTVGKPVTLPDGGAAITVKPTTACNLQAKSVFAPTGKSAKAAAAGTQIVGFGTSTLRVPGATVKVPTIVMPAFASGQNVTIPVRPVTTATRATPPKFDPPPVKVTTTVSCAPIAGLALISSGAGFAPNPTVALSTSGAAQPRPVRSTTTVNPAPLANGPAAAAKLTPGLWSGAMRETVSPRPGAGVSKGRVSFEVSAGGEVTNFRANGAEQCFVPAGTRQGSGVTSIPYFIDLAINGSLTPAPAGKFPRSATFSFSPKPPPASGTQYLKFTSPLLFSNATTASGTVDALRNHPGGVPGTRCQLGFTFDAKPGGTAVGGNSLPSYANN